MLNKFIGTMSLKTKNLKKLYHLVRKLGPVKIDTLIQLTGYKPATCARLLDELVQAKLIYNTGAPQSTVGRRPLMYAIESKAYYIVGIEIASLYVTVLLMDLNFEVIEVKKIEIEGDYNEEEVLQTISLGIHEWLEIRKITNLLGIGVGIIDSLEGGNWGHSLITSYLEKAINTIVLVDNGTSLVALAEYRNFYSKETDFLIFVSSDMEIHSSIISKGRLLTNQKDMLGHTIIDLNGKHCTCGGYGCLHAYSSLPAIHNEIIRRLKRGSQSSLLQYGDVDNIHFHHILQAIEESDPMCLEVVEEAAYYFGIGLANLILTLQPDVVICGGTLVPKPRFFEHVHETVTKRLALFPHVQVQVKKAMTSYNAVAQGAGCMLLEHYS